ncbi:tetratricopeptide repeat protein [Agarilytica rhodophyticola]|uniref:tetratricopeptide repeat protein n=1 Tax=Agarilytica rhodophyticola TaxID=1737490 RepID=UPI000B344E55|nr:tetratricopeptide repeat protein [Agarilytica rhodophyticola]
MKLIISSIVFCVVFFFSTINVAAQNVERLIELGKRSENAGNFKRARIHYQKAILKEASSVEAHVQLAQLELLTGRYQRAFSLSQDILELDASNWQALKLSGDFYLHQKDYMSAMDYFQRLMQEHPDMPYGYLGKSHVLSALGQEDAAEELRAQVKKLTSE